VNTEREKAQNGAKEKKGPEGRRGLVKELKKEFAGMEIKHSNKGEDYGKEKRMRGKKRKV